MHREVFAVVGLMAHALVSKTGAFPREGEVKTLFDSAELMLREALAREERWKRMEDEHDEAKRKARGPLPEPHGAKP